MADTYNSAVETARQTLAMAQSALARDAGEILAERDWTPYLRDRYDVVALADFIENILKQGESLSVLHAEADKARQRQPQRGRPTKSSRKTARPR